MMAYNYPNFYQYGQQQQQIQNGGLVNVRSEAEARNYPVAYGTSVIFKDETAPYIYTKTMGYSQLDRPVFEKFKLTRENAQEPKTEPETNQPENLALDKINGEIGQIWKEIEALKKEVAPDESSV